MHVLVILTDITNYADALREVSAARKEVPGRRGYPGYMYTDLASLYERAGRQKGKSGSITMVPILTMPEDDKTHPIPDLTGYITEGQIVLDRNLHGQAVYPPISILPSLSRLMRTVSEKDILGKIIRILQTSYFPLMRRSERRETLLPLLGEDELSPIDKQYLKFGEEFERRYIGQGPAENRTMMETLDLWLGTGLDFCRRKNWTVLIRS